VRIQKHPVSENALSKIEAAYRKHRGQLRKPAMEKLIRVTGLPRHTIYYHARRNGWTRRRASKGLKNDPAKKFTPLTARERETLSTGELRRRGICCCCKRAAIHPSLACLCWECFTQAPDNASSEDYRCTF
jgi:hypothetical protein